jgi:hypothetical protein
MEWLRDSQELQEYWSYRIAAEFTLSGPLNFRIRDVENLVTIQLPAGKSLSAELEFRGGFCRLQNPKLQYSNTPELLNSCNS